MLGSPRIPVSQRELRLEELKLSKLIKIVSAREPLNRHAVENLFATRFTQTDDTGAFLFYEAKEVTWGGTHLSKISFSEPIPGQGAVVGSTLDIEFTGFCADPDDVLHLAALLPERAVAPLDVVVVTDGGDPGPARFYRMVSTRWGDLTLYYDGQCARSASFRVARPPR